MSPARRALASLLVLVVAATGSPGAGAEANDTRGERERVRRERAAVAADIDVLNADSQELEEAIGALDARMSQEQSQLASAQQAQALATAEAARAAAEAEMLAAEIARLKAETRDAAVRAFIHGGDDLGGWDAPSGRDLGADASRDALRRHVASTAAELADELDATREDHDVARQAAENAAGVAAERAAAAQARLGEVEQAKTQQQAFASQLEERIEARVAEAANLEQLDASLAAKIVEEQKELERRARALARAATPPPVPRAIARATPPAAVRRAPALEAPARPAPTPRPVGSSGGIPLATVRGITVHADIADNLAALLAAADGAGLSLGGGGYRDPAQQQRLREQNCPDPYSSPASSCSPPTARVGASMHEQGLAVDFTSSGRLITSRSNTAFRWLAANAGRFGLQNLPSEPWHWSTNGR